MENRSVKFNFLRLFPIFIAILVFTMPLFAQNRLDIPGLALGRATVAFARGVDALTVNPANLALSSSSATISFTIAPIALMGGSNVMNIKDLKFFFGGDGTKDLNGNPNPRYLNESERDNLLGLIDQGKIASQIESMPLGIVVALPDIGTFGFAIVSSFQMQTQFPDNFSKLLNGYAGKVPINLVNGLYSALLYSNYQLSFATSAINADDPNRPIFGKIAFGGTVKYIRGFAFQEIDPANSISIIPFIPSSWDSTVNWATRVQYKARSAGFDPTAFTLQNFVGFGGNAAGSGFGIDVGFWGNLSSADTLARQAAFAFSILDIGTIYWKQNTSSYSADLRDTVKGVTQITTEQLNRYKGAPDNSNFSSSLPTRIRLGITCPASAFDWDFPLTAMAEYTQGLNNIGVNSTKPRFGFGLQLADKGPTLRLGLQTGGLEGLGFTGGIGFVGSVVAFDLSAGSVPAVFSYATAHWFDYAFRFRFGIQL